jgi:hypothetical protein
MSIAEFGFRAEGALMASAFRRAARAAKRRGGACAPRKRLSKCSRQKIAPCVDTPLIFDLTALRLQPRGAATGAPSIEGGAFVV